MIKFINVTVSRMVASKSIQLPTNPDALQQTDIVLTFPLFNIINASYHHILLVQ